VRIALEIALKTEYTLSLGRPALGRPDSVPNQPSIERKGKTMNRSLLIAALVAVGLTACGEKPAPAPAPKATPAPAPAPAAAPAPAPAPAAAPAEEKKDEMKKDEMKKDEMKKDEMKK
jgi:hypothetical protein